MGKDESPLDARQLDELEHALGREARDRLLRMVAEHARGASALIASAMAQGPGDVRRAAHGLRGAVQTVGAGALADALRAIEVGEPLTDDDPRLAVLAREADAVATAAEALLD